MRTTPHLFLRRLFRFTLVSSFCRTLLSDDQYIFKNFSGAFRDGYPHIFQIQNFSFPVGTVGAIETFEDYFNFSNIQHDCNRNILVTLPCSSYTSECYLSFMLATHLQPARARWVFPCLDEPAYKAVFHLTLIFPRGLIALANTMERTPVEIKYFLSLISPENVHCFLRIPRHGLLWVLRICS